MKTSKHESMETPFGLEWRVRGGGCGRRWFRTANDREQYADKLADKYGGYEVLDLRWSDPPETVDHVREHTCAGMYDLSCDACAYESPAGNWGG
jgi:hypothetical protein